jgi:hypothetical protein
MNVSDKGQESRRLRGPGDPELPSGKAEIESGQEYPGEAQAAREEIVD